MTLRARRWYYSFAILLFLIAAPIVVALAAGWRWQGFRQGFTQTGTLVISATQRSEILLNNELYGTTPKRVSGLVPGTYRLSLRRDGLRTWEHIVTIRPHVTTTIGPVRLFPVEFSSTTLTTVRASGFTVDQSSRTIASWTTTERGTDLNLLWPSSSLVAKDLPAAPTWIRVSPRRQWLAIGLPTGTKIVSLTDPNRIQDLPASEPIAWLTSSENISYQLSSGSIVAHDALTNQQTTVATGHSFTVLQDTLWFTTRVGELTNIYQRTDATAAESRLMTTLPGAWTILGQLGRGIVLDDPTQDAVILTNNRLTGRLETTNLDGLTQWPTQSTTDHPLWLREADIVTLSADRQPTVLLRTTEPLTAVDWIEPEHILATASATSVSLRSVSSRQGRATLLQQALPTGASPLFIDPSSQSFFLQRDGQLIRLRWSKN